MQEPGVGEENDVSINSYSYIDVPVLAVPEATSDEGVWKPDRIEAPVLMILTKHPVWTPE
jgi:hypothetical protein